MALKVARRGQETQWPPRRQPFFLGVGLPVRHRRQTSRGERLRKELQLPRRCAELLTALRRQTDRAGLTHPLRIERGGRPVCPAQHFAEDIGLRHAEDRIIESHPPGEHLRQAEVRPGLSLRRNRTRRVLEIIGAVGAVEVFRLEIRRCRQHDVGVARGHRQKGVMDDGEQILAGEAAADLAGIGARHRRVVGCDQQCPDRRVVEFEQCLAETQTIDDAGFRRPGRFCERHRSRARRTPRSATTRPRLCGHRRRSPPATVPPRAMPDRPGRGGSCLRRDG